MLRRRSFSSRLVRWPLVLAGHLQISLRAGMPWRDAAVLAWRLAWLTLRRLS